MVSTSFVIAIGIGCARMTHDKQSLSSQESFILPKWHTDASILRRDLLGSDLVFEKVSMSLGC